MNIIELYILTYTGSVYIVQVPGAVRTKLLLLYYYYYDCTVVVCVVGRGAT